jgi:hypothetical protein
MRTHWPTSQDVSGDDRHEPYAEEHAGFDGPRSWKTGRTEVESPRQGAAGASSSLPPSLPRAGSLQAELLHGAHSHPEVHAAESAQGSAAFSYSSQIVLARLAKRYPI